MMLSSVLPPACSLAWLGGREVVKPSNGSCEAEAMLAGRAEVVPRIQSWRTWQGLVLVTQLKIWNNSIGLGVTTEDFRCDFVIGRYCGPEDIHQDFQVLVFHNREWGQGSKDSDRSRQLIKEDKGTPECYFFGTL